MARPPRYHTDTYALIYVLTDMSDNVFYVGCTIQPLETRLVQHFAEAKSKANYGNAAKNEKIRSLDFKVKIKEVERVLVSPSRRGSKGYCLNRQGHKAENEWILKFHRMGIPLTNREYWLKKMILEQEVTTNEG